MSNIHFKYNDDGYELNDVVLYKGEKFTIVSLARTELIVENDKGDGYLAQYDEISPYKVEVSK